MLRSLLRTRFSPPRSDRPTRGAKRVLLVAQPYDRRWAGLSRLPPLGPLYLVASLRSRGISADLHDFTAGELLPKMAAPYDVVGFSINMANVNRSLDCIRKIKQAHPEKTVVVGGPQCSQYPEEFGAYHEIDALFVGEAEDSLCEYLLAPEPASVPGLYVRPLNACGWTSTGARPWREDLDTLPFPSLDHIDLWRYRFSIWRRLPISSIFTSRGCPFDCTYCFHNMGRQWRPRGVENVVAELEWQVRTLGAREICIWDDNFTLDVDRAEAICDEIVRRRLDVSLQLSNGIRADRVSSRLLRKMRQAGAWMVCYAPETGCRSTAERIRKRLEPEEVRRAIAWSREAGLCVTTFFMVGFPWETEADIRQTIEFAISLDTDLTEFSRVVPFRGTTLYDSLDEQARNALEQRRPSSYFMRERGLQTGGVGEEVVLHLLRDAHRRIYLRPRSMVRLVRALGAPQVARLFFYALFSGNM